MATADQTVSAVLESTNKRYVVETGQTENGWFTRYSDGFIRQGGIYTAPSPTRSLYTTITFPIAFQEKACTTITAFDLDDEPVLNLEIASSCVRTRLTDFDGKVYGATNPDTPYGFNWVAEGY